MKTNTISINTTGSFEESALNGRLEPAATVPGFTAEIGASGEFCPSHITLPVTVFFYSLGDNTTSSPYLVIIISTSRTVESVQNHRIF